MKLTRLIIQNFLSIQEARLSLNDKGLVSIEGENRDATGSDSNGSGKSSLINSILWCLYGSYGKDELADDVVNSIVGKDCMVETVWDDEGHRYKITRYRKHTKYKNAVTILQDGMDITKAGSGAVQEQINEIMGADELVFRASCFMQQEDDVDIPAMKDKELKELLERCLPFDDLEAAYDEASEKVSNQKKEVTNFNLDIMTQETTTLNIGNELAEARKSFDNFDRYNDAANERTNEALKAKRLARAVALSRANGYAELEKEAREYTERAKLITDYDTSEARVELEHAKRESDKQRAIIISPNNKCDSCGQEVEDLAHTISKAQDKLKAANAAIDKWTTVLKLRQTNKGERMRLLNESEKLWYDIAEKKTAKNNYEKLDAEIKALEASRVRAAVNPHGETVKRLEAALEASKAHLEGYRKELEEATARLEVLEAVQLTFSPKGLRYHMLETVAPTLTDYTNKYLSVLTDGAITAVWSTVSKTASGDYREKFSIEAKMGNRDKFGLLSGGQKRKVRLACFFALQDLIAERATKNIDIWCGDEIDEALDGAGLERLMVLLNEKVKAKSTILVISHNELREWIPNHAIVSMEDGQSTITGYLNE